MFPAKGGERAYRAFKFKIKSIKSLLFVRARARARWHGEFGIRIREQLLSCFPPPGTSGRGLLIRGSLAIIHSTSVNYPGGL